MAEEAIVADVLRIGLPLLAGLAVVGFIGGALAFFENPLRIVTPVVALVLLGGAYHVKRRRPRLAVGLLATALTFAAVFGMLFNGGLRAPAAAIVLALVSLFGWLFGWRGATITALAGSAAVALVSVLMTANLLRETTNPAPIAHAIFLIVYIWVVWTTTALPQRRLRLALLEAAARETARAHEEKRRVESELAFKRVFDHTAQVVMVTSHEGLVLHCNRTASEFFGLQGSTPQQVRGLDWGGARQQLEEAMQQVSRAVPETLEVRRGPARFAFTVSRLEDEQGSPGGLLFEGRDVTRLIDAEQREARARRLSVVGQLAGGVAHDFNNVLAVVTTSAEMLRSDLKEQGAITPLVDENLEAILSSSQRASDLTRRLLRFSRQHPLAPKLISLHEFLESTSKLLVRVLPPRITVTTHLDAPRDTVMADVSSLESALLNLAVNARDAMPGPGSLILTTSCVEPDRLWQASGGTESWRNPFLRLTVSDTGTGIPKALQDRLFEPFVTTKAEGTGIGLASVFATMHEHGGVVSLHSEEGRFTSTSRSPRAR